MSLTQEEAHVVPTSRLLEYLKSIFLKQISPFALNFEHCRCCLCSNNINSH